MSEPAQKLTVVLPTYNGERHLPGCLESIAGQTYRDYHAFIYDNASTDNTPHIAQAFAAQDQRFKYFRQGKNVPALTNFLDGLRKATSPLFIWRADDDLWEPNYLEELIALHDKNPRCKLSVSRVVHERTDKTSRKQFDFPSLKDGDLNRMKLLTESNPSWVYGMFERTSITQVMETIQTRYDETWAADQLILFYFGSRGLIAGTNNTCFTQRVNVQPQTPDASSEHRWKQQRNALEQTEFFADRRHRFSRVATAWIREMTSNPVRVSLWRAFLWHYMAIKLFRARKIWRRRIKYYVLRAKPR